MKRSEHPTLADRRIAAAALCGGTHGNELTGVTAVRRRGGATSAGTEAWNATEPGTEDARSAPSPGTEETRRSGGRHPDGAESPYRPSTFRLTTLIANPEAVARNRRYIDFDLNRCFDDASLREIDHPGYERQRAQVLNARLGPKGSPTPRCDLIIDLHTTTAALGSTIIIRESDAVARFIAAAVTRELPEVRVLSYHSPKGAADFPYLAEITPVGIEVEVGPVPQGVVRGETLLATERIIDACLRSIDAWNTDQPLDAPETVTVYRYGPRIDYPRTPEGAVDGFVHPAFQDRDFQPLYPGDPLFMRYDGDVVTYDGEAGLYPVFINEAAYYEKRIAATLCEKREIAVL